MRKLTIGINSGKQIVLRIGDESRCGECAWIGMGANSGDQHSPAAGIIRLFRGWQDRLRQLADGSELWLPFDFADEQTGWLCIRRDGRTAAIVVGTAAVEGWEISLDEFGSQMPEGFRPDEPLHIQEFYLPRLLADLRIALQELQLPDRDFGADGF